MKRTIICLLALSIGVAMGQPVITGGPVNAASYARAGLPNAGIAQGGMFVLFGNKLGPAAIVTATSFPIKTNLGGTSVQVKMGASTFNALMIYTVVSQVAAIVPSPVPTGDGTVTVTFNGQTSDPVAIHVVANAFGIFTRNQAGTGPAIVFNFNSQADQPVNSLIESANPGQVLTIWGTGLSGVTGDEAGGPLPGDLNIPVDVFIGNKPANIMYRGRSGCCAGIDQIVFTVPDGVQGCYVSVAVRAGGVVSNVTTISVASSSRVCSDPTGFSTADLQGVGGGRSRTIADLYLFRFHVKGSISGVGTIDANLDAAEGHFQRYASSLDVLASTRGSVGGFGTDGGARLPSLGSCIAYPILRYQQIGNALGVPELDDPVNRPQLDAGSALNLTGPRGNKQIPKRGSAGDFEYFDDLIGGGIPGFTPVVPDYLEPGTYTVDNGSGGPDVGAFRATLTIPSSQPVWTNQDAFNNIPRSQDVTVNWSGGAAGGLVLVAGGSADPKTGVAAGFACTTRADAGTFTVPGWLLSVLPASGIDPSAGVPVGGLTVGTVLPQPSRFSAMGVDLGFFTWGALQTKFVNYQ